MTDESEFFRKQPRQSRSRSVVNAILEAADQVLAKAGDPERVSLNGVATRAGVGIGSLYDYFANREGLLGAFLARLTDKNFVELEHAVNATKGLPLDEAVDAIMEAILRTYLEKPERTRATITTIFRLGWVTPVLGERERFARVLVARLLPEFPAADPAAFTSAIEFLCDAVMGVVMAELWRDQTTERSHRVRAEVIALVKRRLETFGPSKQREGPPSETHPPRDS